MKKICAFLLVALAFAGTSCKKYLDINNDPNNATNVTPELILPQALTGTASNLNGYNTYGAQLTGYSANAGGYGGFGTSISYNFSSGDFNARWSTTYDNLEDYQAILNYTESRLPAYSNFNAVARIMKAFNFQLLVDTYNDVPYTEALQGAGKLTPVYTDAKAIYKDLADELDKAMKTINTASTATGITPLGAADVMFGGNMTKWLQFANTLKLRILVFGNGKVSFTNSTFDDAGFLSSDAMINPGYTRDNGRQNPKWDNWAYGYTGSDANKAWMPTKFILAFYTGTKLQDSGRGRAIYYQYPNTGTNALGYENTSVPKCPSGSFWYPGTNTAALNHRKGSGAGDTTGVLKGPNAGFPVITSAESYFLQAEGALKGINPAKLPPANDITYFNKGITASFRYLLTWPDNKTVVGDPAARAATYLSDNSGNFLADYTAASSAAQKLEAIITQKYIAMNYVNSQVAWNDYRRTHYPTIITGGTATQTFASTVSESTRPDKLPTRILYPVSEGAYNSANVPKGISAFSSLIFWAL